MIFRALTLGLLCASPAWAMNPFEKNHPRVQEGMNAFEHGQYDRALEEFDAAQKELGPNATVEANRGVTLHKLGKNEEARDALNRAIELDKGELANRLHYNLGNVYADLKQNKDAIAEYRKALRADPNDALSRHNLEVLLRNLPPKQDQAGQDGGTPDGGKNDAGRPDAGPDGGRPDGGTDAGKPGDGGSGDAGNGDGGTDGGNDGGADGGRGDGGTDGGEKGDGGTDGGQGDGGEPSDGGDKPGDGGSSPGQKGDGGTDGGTDAGEDGEGDSQSVSLDGGASMSKKDAEKLLDSMKNNEKNLQLWRFQQKQKKNRNEKDW